MRGRGSDLGGRWPVGIWFALVGVSAGAVASFATIGWVFTRGLYDGGDAAEPPPIGPETVIVEESTDASEGLARAEAPLPDGRTEPGDEPGPDPEPAEPQAEPVSDPEPEREAAPELKKEEEAEPPRLVPVESGTPGREEDSDAPADGPAHGGDDPCEEDRDHDQAWSGEPGGDAGQSWYGMTDPARDETAEPGGESSPKPEAESGLESDPGPDVESDSQAPEGDTGAGED